MDSASSCSVILGSVIFLTMTALPASDAATSLVRMFFDSKRRRIASATAAPSMMAPSTMLSGGTGSIPKAVTLKDLPEPLSSTALTALEPMSKPTTARDLPNTLDLAWPPHALHSVAPVGRVGRHRAPDHPRGPSLRTSRSAFRLTDDPMSKGGAKARHSVRNWRFYVAAHDTRASNRDPGPGRDITDLLGKLPRNVSDHENLPCFPGEIDCTLVRTLAWKRDPRGLPDGPAAGRRSAQFPDTGRRETDGGPTARPSRRSRCQPRLRRPSAPRASGSRPRRDASTRITHRSDDSPGGPSRLLRDRHRRQTG